MYIDSNPYSTRAQVIMLLLATMHRLKGGNSKRRVIEEIESMSWFARQIEDLTPYPTVSTEARWKTLVAFRRKDCYEQELFEKDRIRDSWHISKDGTNTFVIRRSQFASGEFDCRKCYMWSPAFKEFIDPAYVPSSEDADRPSNVYDDYYKRDQKIIFNRLMERFSNPPIKEVKAEQ